MNGTELGGKYPLSLMTMVMYSAGVRSYIRLRSCKLGTSSHLDNGEDFSLLMISSSGGAISL